MESAALALGKIHLLRVDPGEDVLEAVKQLIAATGLKQAVVLGGYGTLTAHHLHWVADNKLPSTTTFGRGAGGIEILAMNGLVVQGEPHLHVTLSTPAGAYGGHLEPGCTAYVLCEIYLGELVGAELSRERVPVDIAGLGAGSVPRLRFEGPGE